MELYICEKFSDYYESVIDKFGYTNVNIIKFSSRCIPSNQLIEHHNFDVKASCIICTGGCNVQNCLEFERRSINKINACFEYVLDKDFGYYLMKRGALLITNHWLEHWQANGEIMFQQGLIKPNFHTKSWFRSVALIGHAEKETIKTMKSLADFLQCSYEIINPSDNLIREKIDHLLSMKNQAKPIDGYNNTNALIEEKMTMTDRIAGGLAHEINNPLSAISSNVSILKEYIQVYDLIMDHYEHGRILGVDDIMKKKSIVEDMPELISDIDVSIQRIKQIVDRFRSITNIDTQGYYENISVTHLVQNLLYRYNRAFDGTIECDFNHEEVPMVLANRGELAMSIYGIIENAVDAIVYSPYKSYGKIKVQIKNDENHINISIIDNGKSLTQERKHRAFEPFYTTKEIGKGVGLGLTYAYDVINRKHGGQISLSQDENGDTVCSVLMPIHQDY